MKHSVTLAVSSLLFPLFGYAQGVGIGTTAPDRPLTIQPLSNSAEWLSLKNNAGATKWHFNNNNGGFNLAETGVADYRFFVQPGGNIGLGTGAPSQKLTITGGSVFTTSENSGYLVDAQASARVGLLKYGGREGGIWRLDAQDFEIGRVDNSVTALPGAPTTWTTDLYVGGTGYIGVGTTTPFSQLANTSSNIIGSDGNGGNPGSFTWAANQGGYAAMIYNAGTGGASNGLAVKVANSSTYSAFNVSQGTQTGVGTPLFQVTGAGNVGIGTSNPAAKLDITGTTRAQAFTYATAQTRYLSIPSDAFASMEPTAYRLNRGAASDGTLDFGTYGYLEGGTAGSPGYASAPINLPQGAVITAITLVAVDNDGTSVTPQVTIEANQVSAYGYAQRVALTAESTNSQTVSATTNHTVQNDQFFYKAVVRLNQNSSNTRFTGVRLTYTVAQPD